MIILPHYLEDRPTKDADMPLMVYNLTLADVTTDAGNPVVVVPASLVAGLRGPAVNVTSEMRPNLVVDPNKGVTGGLEAADYTALQAQVAAGDLAFEWTSAPEYLTSTLVMGNAGSGEPLVVGPSGAYATINEALAAADGVGTTNVPAVIKITDGTYTEDLVFVNNVKLIAEPGRNVTVVGAASITVPAAEDWKVSVHNIKFSVTDGNPAMRIDNTLGATPPSYDMEFHGCGFESSNVGGSVFVTLNQASRIYDSSFARTVSGSDLLFAGDASVTILDRCEMTAFAVDELTITTAGSGSLYLNDSVLSGCIRTDISGAGTGTITVSNSKIFAGSGAQEAVEIGAGTTVNILDSVLTSSSSRAGKTFTGSGTLSTRGTRFASDVFFPTNPASALTVYKNFVSSEAEYTSSMTTRIVSDDNLVLLMADGATPNTVTDYYVSISAGSAIVNSVLYRTAAVLDQQVVGVGAWAKSFDLTGVAATALADNTEVYAALVLFNVAGSVDTYMVFGTPDAAAAVIPTTAEINYALEQAGVYGSGTVVSIVKYARAAAVITTTYTDPATDDDLSNSRNIGTLFVA